MALEETANSIEDHLIDGLSFKLKPGASYVQSRRSVSFFPQGGNHYSSTGVKVIKISLTGSQGEWLDPSTLAVHYTINNTATESGKLLHFLSGPWCVFRRMRVICGGTIIEDVDQYARVCELFHTLSSSAKRRNDSILGFNTSSVDLLYNLENKPPLSNSFYQYDGISDTKTVMFTPLSGLCNQDKYLPLRYMGGLTLEFELISDPTECVISEAYTYPEVTTNTVDTHGVTTTVIKAAIPVILANALSTSWTISDVQVKCDVIQLDNNLNDEYVKYLLSGKSLAINYNTFVSQYQTLSSTPQNSVNITRSLSRLKNIFVSHYAKPVLLEDCLLHKEFNTFFIQ